MSERQTCTCVNRQGVSECTADICPESGEGMLCEHCMYSDECQRLNAVPKRLPKRVMT